MTDTITIPQVTDSGAVRGMMYALRGRYRFLDTIPIGRSVLGREIFGLLLGAVVSFLLGIIAALYRDRWPDQVIRIVSIAGLATPSFWLAVLLILLFAAGNGVLPL